MSSHPKLVVTTPSNLNVPALVDPAGLDHANIHRSGSNLSAPVEWGSVSSTKDWKMPRKTPVPMYRHAMPSGPWPWMDFNKDIKPGEPLHEIRTPSSVAWQGYPQSLFPNWSPTQVKRSEVMTRCPKTGRCCIYRVDVFHDGVFDHGSLDVMNGSNDNDDHAAWEAFQDKPEGTRVRALFVENMTVPVLQMLGTQYNIEPFFFTSSVNWIPSRYQEEATAKGDHITITLPFIRAMSCASQKSLSSRTIDSYEVIDTQSPLYLHFSNNMLVLDLMSIHLVRSLDANTIISYHPNIDGHRTSAERMHGLLYYIGQSVYWKKIFKSTKDPTFILLAMLWYALYAWDESFEILYDHINQLESSVINTTEIHLTRELHVIQAHLLYYATLLEDFSKSVHFVLDTPHPGLTSLVPDECERNESNDLLKKECNNLLSAISRVQGIRDMQSKRLENVMHLAFATVNIDDSKQMKQISYLSMIFLPASFTGTVFGMNVKEINSGSYETLAHYVITTVLLTVLTIWTVVTFQTNSHFHGPGTRKSFLVRLCWPVRAVHRSLVMRLDDLITKNFHRGENRDVDEEKGDSRCARCDDSV